MSSQSITGTCTCTVYVHAYLIQWTHVQYTHVEYVHVDVWVHADLQLQ